MSSCVVAALVCVWGNEKLRLPKRLIRVRRMPCYVTLFTFVSCRVTLPGVLAIFLLLCSSFKPSSWFTPNPYLLLVGLLTWDSETEESITVEEIRRFWKWGCNIEKILEERFVLIGSHKVVFDDGRSLNVISFWGPRQKRYSFRGIVN